MMLIKATIQIDIDSATVRALNRAAFYVERPECTPKLTAKQQILITQLSNKICALLGMDWKDIGEE